MTPNDDDDEREYEVVINDANQYSIWLADREPPAGWHITGKSGKRAECLAHIGEVWKDNLTGTTASDPVR